MKRRNETLVGIVLFLGVIVAVFGTLWLQGWQWGRNVVHVEAAFEDVAQASAGNAVRVRGVQIGRITEVSVAPSGEYVRVVLRVDADITLPPDPAVVLAPESLFGDWQADIVSRDQFPNFPFAEVEDPEVLPGYAFPDISRLTATADRISENLADLTDRIGIAFSEETAENLARTIQNIEGMSNQVAILIEQQAMTFDELVDGMERTSEEIERAAAAGRSVFERLDGVLASGEMEMLLSDVRSATAEVEQLSREAGATSREFSQMAVRADSAFARVGRVLEVVETGDGALAQLLYDPGLAGEMESTLVQLQLLLEDVRENPRRYLRLSIF